MLTNLYAMIPAIEDGFILNILGRRMSGYVGGGSVQAVFFLLLVWLRHLASLSIDSL
jgi:hypothetical protein